MASYYSRLDQGGGQYNGSITSSSQSSDDSEEPSSSQDRLRPHRRQRSGAVGSYRSSSLPRHSSMSGYKRSITMPNIRSQDDNSNKTGISASTSYNNKNVIGQIQPLRPASHSNNANVQLTTWLQSLTGMWKTYIKINYRPTYKKLHSKCS